MVLPLLVVGKNECFVEKSDLQIGTSTSEITSDLKLLPEERVGIKSIHYCLGRQNIPNSFQVNVTNKTGDKSKFLYNHVIWQTIQSCKVWNVPKDDRIINIKTRYINDKTFLIVSLIFQTLHG